MIGYRSVPVNRTTPAAPKRANPVRNSVSRLRRHRPDYGILLLTLLLLVIGLVVVYSISPALNEATSHATNYTLHGLMVTGLAIIAFVAAANIPLSTWDKYKKPLIIAAIAATALAIVMPVNLDYPAHRWVRLGGFSFQSVELVKFVLIIWLSAFLARRKAEGTINEWRPTIKPLLIILLVGGAAIAVLQSDLGSAGVLVAMMAVMAFIAGFKMQKLLLAVVLIVGLVLIVSLPVAYRRERLQTFFNPTADCQDSGYQSCQALISVGSGGFFGLGLGRSVQAYGYLPEAANDSIFAIYAEKFGFVGSVVLLLIFAGLFKRLASIAERVPDDRMRLLVVGMLIWLAIQTIINIGAMLGLLPLKGITLPFISYGGTSLVFMTAGMGLVFQVSRYTDFRSPLGGGRRIKQ